MVPKSRPPPHLRLPAKMFFFQEFHLSLVRKSTNAHETSMGHEFPYSHTYFRVYILPSDERGSKTNLKGVQLLLTDENNPFISRIQKNVTTVSDCILSLHVQHSCRIAFQGFYVCYAQKLSFRLPCSVVE